MCVCVCVCVIVCVCVCVHYAENKCFLVLTFVLLLKIEIPCNKQKVEVGSRSR